jgi:uncharacterized membrane protein
VRPAPGRLYTTPSWPEAAQIIARYGIRYIVVAPLERTTYAVQEAKFRQHLPVIFRQGAVTIYEVPPDEAPSDG